ncbi:MAG: tRNA (N6-isopentenyl adenosine(37)-C2)-methylthiotransferase MiaB [Spirochaetales bacterium]
MTYFFETYGCQMNKAESAGIEHLLLQRGWTSAPSGKTADLIIINTCSVRLTAETRIAGRLGIYSALRKKRTEVGEKFTIVVTGCMAERLRDELKKKFPIVDYVVGNFQKKHFTDIAFSLEQAGALSEFSADFDEESTYTFAPLSAEKDAFQAFVPIMHGCNNFCTYCIVPYVRGREISRSPKDILQEIDILSAQGVKEITVLGQNVNSYYWHDEKTHILTDDNLPVDFPRLTEIIARHLRDTDSSIKWIRFMSSHPKDLSDDLIDVMSRERALCRHIHVPVQHGSTAVLQRMNRKYSRNDYIDLINRITTKIPDVSLTTDILIGFPGETEDDFKQTTELMELIEFDAAFMYYYNPREGTPAANYEDQISLEVKKERLAKIIALQQQITQKKMSRRLGQIHDVLAQGVSRDNDNELIGKTEQDERIVFEAAKENIGFFVKVRLDELQGNTFRGTIQT